MGGLLFVNDSSSEWGVRSAEWYNGRERYLGGGSAMATTREKLQATLAELQAELTELGELDSPTRERLRETLSEISTALARQMGSSSAVAATESSGQRIADEEDTTLDDEASGQSLAERLNDATRGLESTHPELSTTL